MLCFVLDSLYFTPEFVELTSVDVATNKERLRHAGVQFPFGKTMFSLSFMGHVKKYLILRDMILGWVILALLAVCKDISPENGLIHCLGLCHVYVFMFIPRVTFLCGLFLLA